MATSSFNIGDLNSDIAALNSKFLVEGKSNSSISSVSAGTVADVDIDVSKAGYTPVGVVGALINSGGGCCLISSYIRSSSFARVRIRNTASSAATPDSIYIDVLYMKS